MRLEDRKSEERKEEQQNAPLSTAALAHADERREPVNRAQERDREPLVRREAADGGPTLMQPGTTRAGEPARIENRMEGMANRQSVVTGQPGATGKTPDDDQNAPLFSEQESRDLFAKWDAMQVGFIDEPRRAVEQADNLVATAMKRTAEVFAEERARLERQWDRGDNVSTEDLRVAMRRYRSFFRRLLSV
jgi:hypothetical protein